MKKPETVLRELGQLYEFQKKLASFKFRKKRRANKADALDASSSHQWSQR